MPPSFSACGNPVTSACNQTLMIQVENATVRERLREREGERGGRRAGAGVAVSGKATLLRQATLLSVTRSLFSHGRWFCKMLKKKHKNEKRNRSKRSELATLAACPPFPLPPLKPLLTRRRCCHVTNNTPREQPKGGVGVARPWLPMIKAFFSFQLWFILSTALPASQSPSPASPSFATLNFVMTAELILLRGDFLPSTWAGPFFSLCLVCFVVASFFFFYCCWVDNFATPAELLLFDKL